MIKNLKQLYNTKVATANIDKLTTKEPLQKKGQQIADSIKANQQVQKAKEALKPINIAKGAAIGTAKDVVKMTTGKGEGGAATDLINKGMRKIGTSTGYMVGRAAKGVASKMMDFLEGPKKDYTKWNENIRKGKPLDNLK